MGKVANTPSRPRPEPCSRQPASWRTCRWPPPRSCRVAVGLTWLEHHGVPPASMVRPGVSFAPGAPASVRVSGSVAFVLLVPGLPGAVMSRLVTVALRLAVPGT